MATEHSHSTITIRSRELRRESTVAERALWRVLRMHQVQGVHFRRQYGIGSYIVDFCAPQKKLVIELDGGQHAKQVEYDAARTVYLESRGYRVIRFWNYEVLRNMEGVLLVIEGALEAK